MDLTLTSWNIHGLPYPLDLHFWPFSRIPRYPARTDSIARRVLSHLPDVAVFQEVWTDEGVRRLTQHFSRAGYTVCPPPAGRFPRKGGLLTCVKNEWEVRSERFTEYLTEPPAASSDARSHKGVQSLTLARGNERLTVLNTHLQSQYPPRHSYADIRRAQILKLTEVAAGLAEGGVPMLAVGDFNTYPYPVDIDAYRAMSTGPWQDLTKAARAACGCETNYDSKSPEAMEGWIDYLLARRDDQLAIEADISLLRNRSIDNPYSDHHGLLARIRASGMVAGTAAAAALALIGVPTTRRQWLHGTGALLFGRRSAPAVGGVRRAQ